MLFEDAPPSGIERRFGLIKPGQLNTQRRALDVVLVGWVPLVVLSIIQGFIPESAGAAVLITQVATHARYLIAAPLLVVAESMCAPQLDRIIRHFAESGIVAEQDVERLDGFVASTRRLLRHPIAEAAAIALAYSVVLIGALTRPAFEPQTAATAGPVPHGTSLAVVWQMLVSFPILLVLFLGWFWRLALWVRLLWLISKFDLRLLPSHPDRCAGLGFLGHSLRAFAVVALAIATIVAGRAADMVLAGGRAPTAFIFLNAVLMATTILLFIAPLLTFTPTLSRVWREATFSYGAVAGRIGATFEGEWLTGGKPASDPLDSQAFSATTDLYSVVSNVYAIRFAPVELKDVLVLAVAILLPFVPVLLLAVPLNVILTEVKGFFF